MLNSGLSELELKVYKGCTGSEFYTKLGIKSDTEGIIVMHCRLALLKDWNTKVPFAHVLWQKLWVVGHSL